MSITKVQALITGLKNDNPKVYEALLELSKIYIILQEHLVIDASGDLVLNAVISGQVREVFRITSLGQIIARESPSFTPQNRFPFQFPDGMRVGPLNQGTIFLGRATIAGWGRGLELREYDATHMAINSRSAVPAAMDLVLQSGGGKVGIGTGGTALTYDIELAADSAGKPATAVWNVISDERTKKEKRDFTSGLDKIVQMKPYEAKYNGEMGTPNDLPVFGLTAQELLLICPEMVTVPADPEKPMSINYHNLFPLLVNSIIELSAKVKDLDTRLKAKEN